jgi:transcriptional regulator GlxA family with amidase domain
VLSREELPLEALAARVHLSPSWLSRTFAQEVGMTISAYRNHLRFERFQALRRRDGRANLLTLALRAGFGSYAQFHRIHRQLTGHSPRER